MTEDEVINAMMTLTERLAADVHELSSQIVNLTHTVNTLRQEVNYKLDTPPTKGDTHG
jgi:uncharacterized protein YoxC